MKRDGNQISAIVVDDDRDMVSVISELLQLGDVNVIGVGYNGKEAVDLYRKLRPDVVFLDIMMPHYDGFYAIENIRLLNKQAKILMITADLSSETEEKLKRIPSLEVVYKAFNLNDLLSGINKLFDGSVDNMAYKGASYTMIAETV